jgi:hypothetical protein
VKEYRLLIATIIEKIFKALLILSLKENTLLQIRTLKIDIVIYKELFGKR